MICRIRNFSLLSLFLLSALGMSTLTGCSLGASLLGDGGKTLTATYKQEEKEQTMTAIITILKGEVTAFKLTPGAVTTPELAHQMAFAANVRKYFVGKNVGEIALPDVVGEGEDAERLTGIFKEQILSKIQQ